MTWSSANTETALNRSAASLALELQQRQAEAIATVNQTHGKTRLRHITVIEGQGMLYMDKHAEAEPAANGHSRKW